MKKFINIRLITAIAFLAGLSACSVEEPLTIQAPEQQKVSVNSENAVAGELLVCFDSRVSDILDKAGVTKSGPSMPVSQSGILSVDEILELVEGYEIERVFPVDVRSEEKARNEGFHLWYVVRFSDKYDVETVASDLSKLGEVSRVEFNRTLKRASDQKAKPLTKAAYDQMRASAKNAYFNDPHLPLQWHMVNNGDLGNTKFIAGSDIQVEKAWEMSTGDPSIIVAILDEGIDISHPDLQQNIWVNEDEVKGSYEDNDGNGYAGDYHGYNFAARNGMLTTGGRYDTGHGTHVAGVIAASNNNGVGISSVAGGNGSLPGVKLMSCQIFSGALAATVLDEVRAIKYAADNGAVVLQCSWGYMSGAANPYDWMPQFATDEEWESANILERNALNYFVHNAGSPDGVIEGGIVVFAGGNEWAPAASYPAAHPDYIGVAATAADYTPAVYTNYGPGTDISAPGGDQDYYYEYGEGPQTGYVGCVLSTLPVTVTGEDGEFTGYGYMEGTSMACPHVSGVVALGLSYAAQLRKHFKADEIKKMLLETTRPVEDYWNFDNPKNYYKYVADLDQLYLSSMDLNNYRGKMGSGMVNAYGFLKAIEQSGVEMTFPNVFVALNGQTVLAPSMYFENGASQTYTVSIADTAVASCSVEGNKLVFKGLAAGQTTASISSSGGKSYDFVITVRDRANGNGWL